MEGYIPYRAFLVRIWPTKRGGQEGHRATAEDVATGERKHFPDLESLFVFLQASDEDPSRASPEGASQGCCGVPLGSEERVSG